MWLTSRCVIAGSVYQRAGSDSPRSSAAKRSAEESPGSGIATAGLTSRLQLLPQIEPLVSLREVVERAEDLVAALLVERACLEGMRVESHRVAVALARIGFGLVHQRGRPSLAANRLVDPQIGDVEPATPDAAEQPAQHLAATALENQVDRVVGR